MKDKVTDEIRIMAEMLRRYRPNNLMVHSEYSKASRDIGNGIIKLLDEYSKECTDCEHLHVLTTIYPCNECLRNVAYQDCWEPQRKDHDE